MNSSLKARECEDALDHRLVRLVRREDGGIRNIGPLPAGWRAAPVEGIPPTIRQSLRGCAEGRQRWPLYIYGPPGTRKTWSSLITVDWAGGLYATAAALADHYTDIRWGRVLHSGSGGLKFTTEDFWRRLSGVNLLVIDELGIRNNPTDNEFAAVHGALEARSGKPLLLIANAPPAQLGLLYDERIVSRCMAGTIVEVVGEDSRSAHHTQHTPPTTKDKAARKNWSAARCPNCGGFNVKRLRTCGDSATFECYACPENEDGKPHRFIAQRTLTATGRSADC